MSGGVMVGYACFRADNRDAGEDGTIDVRDEEMDGFGFPSSFCTMESFSIDTRFDTEKAANQEGEEKVRRGSHETHGCEMSDAHQLHSK